MKHFLLIAVTLSLQLLTSVIALASFDISCQWSNNLNLVNTKTGKTGTGTKIEIKGLELKGKSKALSLENAQCGKGTVTCYGQTSCVGNGKRKDNSKFFFDYYSYAICVGKKGVCPSAKECLLQKGKLTSFSQIDKERGGVFIESSRTKKRAGKSDKILWQRRGTEAHETID